MLPPGVRREFPSFPSPRGDERKSDFKAPHVHKRALQCREAVRLNCVAGLQPAPDPSHGTTCQLFVWLTTHGPGHCPFIFRSFPVIPSPILPPLRVRVRSIMIAVNERRSIRACLQLASCKGARMRTEKSRQCLRSRMHPRHTCSRHHACRGLQLWILPVRVRQTAWPSCGILPVSSYRCDIDAVILDCLLLTRHQPA